MSTSRRLSCFVLLAIVALSSATDCGNGLFCAPDQTCTTSVAHVGHRHMCAPAVDAVVCADARFACPAAHRCALLKGVCVPAAGNHTVPLLQTVSAHKPLFKTALPQPSGPTNLDICGLVAPVLPSFCQCADSGSSSNITCSINFLDIDTIGVQVLMNPCTPPASISMDIVEADMGIDYPIADLVAGIKKQIPVPGLNVIVPELGTLGVVVDVAINGDLSAFEVRRVANTECMLFSLPRWGIR